MENHLIHFCPPRHISEAFQLFLLITYASRGRDDQQPEYRSFDRSQRWSHFKKKTEPELVLF